MRRQLSRMADIDGEAWTAMVAPISMRLATPVVRRLVAVWLWSELASGPYQLAPGYALIEPADSRYRLYYHFVRKHAERLSGVLLAYGTALVCDESAFAKAA